MSDSVTLSVESRSKTGSKVSRSLRKNSKVPGILYAHGQPAELITLDPKEVRKHQSLYFLDDDERDVFVVNNELEGLSAKESGCILLSGFS